ncbi:MAG: oligoendopeptidase F [Mollicutes bacterium]|nr:oligoendopeptidase F [Mollicutes bacterium]MDD7613703.1 oligoendopeptidase F [Mollicutes bacterium]MDY4642639.1 oligoendopeptidase F [Candidatus Enterosoma sp.]MDY4783255.1 oligoendopeptidase F [Candidatus Enterosoma sp.]MDY5852442.1 oligoendopeptidase F [Candidatus Enterosoma sp.]
MDKVWNLTHIYKTQEDFEKDLDYAKKVILPGITELEGKLKNEEDLVKYFDLERKANEVLNHLGRFASRRSDLDKKNVKNLSDLAKIDNLFNDFGSADSYSTPEILSLGKEHREKFFINHPEYKDFDFQVEKIFRGEKFTLPAVEERLLSYYAPLEGSGSSLYSQLSVGDYTPKKITLSSGKEVEVNRSNWTSLEGSLENPEDRKKVFLSLYSWYNEHKNTYGEIYNSVVQSELSERKARGYSSILQEHLYHNKIDESVFHNLVEAANENAEPLHKYYEIRRKYFGLDHHRSYDRFLSLAKSEKKYTYEEAKEIFFDSIKDYPEDYQKKAQDVLAEGYVDVYPRSGKRTGGYSSGSANVHPYILLNFNGDLEDVFTLAHEAGHSVHTLYSEEAQPLVKQDYTIFVAEIASTFNEHNLLDYFRKSKSLSKNDKIALLQKSIDQIVSTFYRQTLFAQYEYEISQKAERGEPINYQVLSDERTKLYKAYYGIDITEEELKPLVWAYIPHLFYTPFYVYQYATSFTASMLIYKNFRSGTKDAFDNYLKMLKSGGSRYPIDEVKLAGVDLTKKEAFSAVTGRRKELVEELDKLLNE